MRAFTPLIAPTLVVALSGVSTVQAETYEGAIFSVGSQPFRISYQAGDGNDIALFAVPEPATPAVVVLALAYILGAGRPKRYRRMAVATPESIASELTTVKGRAQEENIK